MALILNTAQATAVRDAMCALNNVGGRMSAEIGGILVYEAGDGPVTLGVIGAEKSSEQYANQNSFFAAYGISEPVAA